MMWASTFLYNDNMHITPWSIYDKPFHKQSKPQVANIESPKNLKDHLPTPKQQIASPKSKLQTFYSFSIMKPLKKQMNLLIALKCIHSTLEEPSLNCISLPRIVNPLVVRHKAKSLQHKGKNKFKKIKLRQGNQHKHKTVDYQLKNAEKSQLFEQCPFNDEKLIQYRHPQTHRNIMKLKLDAIASPI